MIKLAPYVKVYLRYFSESFEYERLKMTGRWKVSFNPYQNDAVISVEHVNKDGMTSWIHEADIDFCNDDKVEYINTCN